MVITNKKNNKVCFVHVSRGDSSDNSIKLLPIGLIAIADYVFRNGIKPLIIHLKLEKSLEPNFDLCEFIKKNKYSIVLFDLHWHYQSYHVIKTISELKQKIPDLKIIVGGFTASFFHREIMNEFKNIDFVVRGDPELPLLILLRYLNNHETNFKDIPNLSWRKAKRIIHNLHTYVVDQETIDKLCFTNFRLMRNYENYIKNFSTGLNQDDNIPIFYYAPGRGCLGNCSYCGGSNISQGIINKRTGIILINHKSVIKELNNLRKYNIHRVDMAYDPDPQSKYYIDLFKEIRKKRLKLSIIFGSFGLPSEDFVDEFKKTFNKDSIIIISPETGSEIIRKKNKSFFYTNSGLIKTLLYIRKEKIRVQISLTVGLPYETKLDILKTLVLINYLKNNFHGIEFNIEAIEIEPAAPWFIYKKKFGILNKNRTFKDFYNAHKCDSSLICSNGNLSVGEIKSIVKLYYAEARCIYEKSIFMKFLSDFLFIIENIDFQILYTKCNSCIEYNTCFRDFLKINAQAKEGLDKLKQL